MNRLWIISVIASAATVAGCSSSEATTAAVAPPPSAVPAASLPVTPGTAPPVTPIKSFPAAPVPPAANLPAADKAASPAEQPAADNAAGGADEEAANSDDPTNLADLFALPKVIIPPKPVVPEPAPVPVAEAPLAEPPPPEKAPRPTLRLVGFVETDDIRVLLSVDGKLNTVAVGESVEGVSLVGIEPPVATLKHAEDQFEINLFEQPWHYKPDDTISGPEISTSPGRNARPAMPGPPVPTPGPTLPPPPNPARTNPIAPRLPFPREAGVPTPPPTPPTPTLTKDQPEVSQPAAPRSSSPPSFNGASYPAPTP